MRVIENVLSTELKSVEIVPFFDLHIGSNKCDLQKLQADINYVKETENAYCILGGDLINNSIIGSVAQADLYDNSMSPMEQIKLAIQYFEPIKDKILCITSGNHERRSYKSDGIDLVSFFAVALGLESKYDYVGCVCFVRFGWQINNAEARRLRGTKNPPHSTPVVYSIYVTHGDGINGRTLGAKANGLERRGELIDADIVLTGHTHQPLAIPRTFLRIDYHGKRVIEHEQLMVSAGSYLTYEAYAELYGMKPTSRRNPRVFLDGEKKLATQSF